MKDYKVDKASLSKTFCQEVYQVVCEIPAGKGIYLWKYCRVTGNASMFPYGRACFGSNCRTMFQHLAIGWSMHQDVLSPVGKSKNYYFWKRDFFQTKWVRRLGKASLELLRF